MDRPSNISSTPQSGEIDVRRAHDHELEDVVRLRWIWTTDDRGATPSMTEEQYVDGAAAWARAHAETHLPHVAVTLGGDIIGMAWLALTPRVATTHSLDRWSGDLQSCFVLPSWRGRGIGGRLVQAVLASAAEHGAEHVTVHASPASTAMYQRNGFRTSPLLLFAHSDEGADHGDHER